MAVSIVSYRRAIAAILITLVLSAYARKDITDMKENNPKKPNGEAALYREATHKMRRYPSA